VQTFDISILYAGNKSRHVTVYQIQKSLRIWLALLERARCITGMHCFASSLIAVCENLARLTVKQMLQLLSINCEYCSDSWFDQKKLHCCAEHGSSPALAIFGDEEQTRLIGLL